MSVLTIPSVNGSPIVEYRDIDGHPVPYMVTIQRRMLTPDGDEYLDGASEWRTITIGEVADQIRIDGPVAEWLRSRTRVDTSPRALIASGGRDKPAYLWNANATQIGETI